MLYVKMVQVLLVLFFLCVYIINEKYTGMDLKSIPLWSDFQRTQNDYKLASLANIFSVSLTR